MTEVSTPPPAEVLKKPDIPIKESWVRGFMRGTGDWPQMNDGAGLFTTLAIVKDPPTDWVALNDSKLSKDQQRRVNKVTGFLQRKHRGHLDAAEHATDGDQTLDEGNQPLWEDIIQENVMETICRYITTPVPQRPRPPEEKAKIIQDFFDNTDNRGRIEELTRTLEVASNALLTPDSKALSDFYQASLTGSPANEKLRDQYKTRYMETFKDNGISFDDEPARATWNLAAHNVRTAFVTELPGQDTSWFELESGDEMTPWYRSREALTKALPAGIIAADAAPSGMPSASIDPEGLLVQDKYIGSELLPASVVAKLRADFIPYWEKQVIRMDNERIPEKMRMDIQEAFDQQVEIYMSITGGVDQAFRHDPGLDEIILNHDLDNVAGVVMETDEVIKAGGLENKKLEDLEPEEHDLLQTIHLQDIYDRWIWNPAWVNAVQFVHDKYKGDPRHKVTQGILTTKDQRGLDRHFRQMLDKELPGIFSPENIMSSTDGAAERLVPEIITPQGPRDRKGRRVNEISLQQALDAIHASGKVKDVIMEHIVNAGGGILSDYDTKLFMMGVQLDHLIQQGLAGEGAEPTADVDPKIYNDLFRKKMVMLADDGIPSKLDHPGIGFIHVPRFRTPDSPDIPSWD